MKKLLGIIVILGMASMAEAASVRYFQDVKMEATAELGLKASSGAVNSQLKMNNATNDNQTVIMSTNSTGHTIYLPESDGTAGQVLKTGGNGQWGWTTAITEGGNATFDNINANSIHVSTAQVDGVITAGNAIISGPVSAGSVDASSVTASGAVTGNDVVATDALVGNSVNVSTAQVGGVISAGNIVTTGPGSFGAGITASSATFSGAVVAGSVESNGDVAVARDSKFILNKDNGSNSYIEQNTTDDTIKFFRNGVEYMRFE